MSKPIKIHYVSPPIEDEPRVPIHKRYPRTTTRKDYWGKRRAQAASSAPITEDEDHPVEPITIVVSVIRGEYDPTKPSPDACRMDHVITPEERINIPEAIMVNAAKMATKAFEAIEIKRLAGEITEINNVHLWNADYAEGSAEPSNKIRS